MQLLSFKAMPQRLLYYWAVSYAEQLGKGNDYSALKPTIVICFADYDVFPGRSGYHSRFQLVDHDRRALCSALEIHILELPKFPADPKTVATPGQYEVGPQMFKDEGDAKDPAGNFTKSKLGEVSNQGSDTAGDS